MNWVIIIFSLVIGFCAVFYGVKLLKLYFKIKSWNRIQAKVISKAVMPKKLSQSSRTSKIVVIAYEYEFNSHVYQNNRVFLVEFLNGERGFRTKDGKKFIQKIGEQISIYVDPKNPQQSIIYSDGLLMYLFMIAFGGIVFLVGIGKLIMAL